MSGLKTFYCILHLEESQMDVFSTYFWEIEAIRTIAERFRYRFGRVRTCEPDETRPNSLREEVYHSRRNILW